MLLARARGARAASQVRWAAISSDQRPWYYGEPAVTFGCTMCGKCCRVPGNVYVERAEIAALARNLGEPAAAFERRAVTESLAVHELIDERDVFVDCVRRVRFYSTAKIFVIDDFSYEVTLSDDDYCGLDPSRNDTTTEDSGSLESTSAAAAAAGCPPWWWTSAVACSCAASMVGLGRGAQIRRRGKARPSRRGVAR